ncbi:MAG TPA: low molecular weight protein-tyrosine-phosphatase [Solirubrobacteraceae bacterium]|nr:low molecular weight protein-tyrosine-phosphatase [Solirubrobacteraceae bacterium]
MAAGSSDESGFELGEPVRLLFVCLGNICRSPTAEGVMRDLLDHDELGAHVEVDSAGTGAWHVGSAPDARAGAAAASRGVTLAGAARQVTPADFEQFDLLLAMDKANLRDLRALARDEQQRAKVRLLREFDPASLGERDLDVPDPYYGGEDGFGEVYDLVRAACLGLLEEIRAGRVP